MRISWRLAALVVFLFVLFPGLAQVPALKTPATHDATAAAVASPTATATPNVVANPAVGEPVLSMSEADLYKLLYEGQKEANKDLTQVMYWSIGLVAAFLLAIAGSQVFFNFRLRKSDIEKMQQTSAKQISESLASAKDEISNLVREGEIENRAARDELSKYLSGRIDMAAERIDTVVKSLDDISSRIKPFEKLPFKISALEIKFASAEAHLWRLRGVESNALVGFVRACNLLLENNQPSGLIYRLSEIEEALTKMEDLSTRDYDELAELMPKIPEEFHEERDRIVAIYEKLPVYEFDKKDNPRDKTTWTYIRNVPGTK